MSTARSRTPKAARVRKIRKPKVRAKRKAKPPLDITPDMINKAREDLGIPLDWREADSPKFAPGLVERCKKLCLMRASIGAEMAPGSALASFQSELNNETSRSQSYTLLDRWELDNNEEDMAGWNLEAVSRSVNRYDGYRVAPYSKWYKDVNEQLSSREPSALASPAAILFRIPDREGPKEPRTFHNWDSLNLVVDSHNQVTTKRKNVRTSSAEFGVMNHISLPHFLNSIIATKYSEGRCSSVAVIRKLVDLHPSQFKVEGVPKLLDILDDKNLVRCIGERRKGVRCPNAAAWFPAYGFSLPVGNVKEVMSTLLESTHGKVNQQLDLITKLNQTTKEKELEAERISARDDVEDMDVKNPFIDEAVVFRLDKSHSASRGLIAPEHWMLYRRLECLLSPRVLELVSLICHGYIAFVEKIELKSSTSSLQTVSKMQKLLSWFFETVTDDLQTLQKTVTLCHYHVTDASQVQKSTSALDSCIHFWKEVRDGEGTYKPWKYDGVVEKEVAPLLRDPMMAQHALPLPNTIYDDDFPLVAAGGPDRKKKLETLAEMKLMEAEDCHADDERIDAEIEATKDDVGVLGELLKSRLGHNVRKVNLSLNGRKDTFDIIANPHKKMDQFQKSLDREVDLLRKENASGVLRRPRVRDIAKLFSTSSPSSDSSQLINKSLFCESGKISPPDVILDMWSQDSYSTMVAHLVSHCHKSCDGEGFKLGNASDMKSLEKKTRFGSLADYTDPLIKGVEACLGRKLPRDEGQSIIFVKTLLSNASLRGYRGNELGMPAYVAFVPSAKNMKSCIVVMPLEKVSDHFLLAPVIMSSDFAVSDYDLSEDQGLHVLKDALYKRGVYSNPSENKPNKFIPEAIISHCSQVTSAYQQMTMKVQHGLVIQTGTFPSGCLSPSSEVSNFNKLLTLMFDRFPTRRGQRRDIGVLRIEFSPRTLLQGPHRPFHVQHADVTDRNPPPKPPVTNTDGPNRFSNTRGLREIQYRGGFVNSNAHVKNDLAYMPSIWTNSEIGLIMKASAVLMQHSNCDSIPILSCVVHHPPDSPSVEAGVIKTLFIAPMDGTDSLFVYRHTKNTSGSVKVPNWFINETKKRPFQSAENESDSNIEVPVLEQVDNLLLRRRDTEGFWVLDHDTIFKNCKATGLRKILAQNGLQWWEFLKAHDIGGFGSKFPVASGPSGSLIANVLKSRIASNQLWSVRRAKAPNKNPRNRRDCFTFSSFERFGPKNDRSNDSKEIQLEEDYPNIFSGALSKRLLRQNRVGEFVDSIGQISEDFLNGVSYNPTAFDINGGLLSKNSRIEGSLVFDQTMETSIAMVDTATDPFRTRRLLYNHNGQVKEIPGASGTSGSLGDAHFLRTYDTAYLDSQTVKGARKRSRYLTTHATTGMTWRRSDPMTRSMLKVDTNLRLYAMIHRASRLCNIPLMNGVIFVPKRAGLSSVASFQGLLVTSDPVPISQNVGVNTNVDSPVFGQITDYETYEFCIKDHNLSNIDTPNHALQILKESTAMTEQKNVSAHFRLFPNDNHNRDKVPLFQICETRFCDPGNLVDGSFRSFQESFRNRLVGSSFIAMASSQSDSISSQVAEAEVTLKLIPGAKNDPRIVMKRCVGTKKCQTMDLKAAMQEPKKIRVQHLLAPPETVVESSKEGKGLNVSFGESKKKFDVCSLCFGEGSTKEGEEESEMEGKMIFNRLVDLPATSGIWFVDHSFLGKGGGSNKFLDVGLNGITKPDARPWETIALEMEKEVYNRLKRTNPEIYDEAAPEAMQSLRAPTPEGFDPNIGCSYEVLKGLTEFYLLRTEPQWKRLGLEKPEARNSKLDDEKPEAGDPKLDDEKPEAGDPKLDDEKPEAGDPKLDDGTVSSLKSLVDVLCEWKNITKAVDMSGGSLFSYPETFENLLM